MKEINNKKKVLVIISGGLRMDGISLTQLDYYKRINKEKFEISVVSFSEEFSNVEKLYKECGCQIVKLPDRRKKIFGYLIALNKVMKKNKYDIIHVHGSSHIIALDLFVAKLNKIPTRIAHSRNTRCNNNMIHKLLTLMFNDSYTIGLACGQEAGEWLFNKKDFIVFHNGKDLEKFKFNSEIRKKIRDKYNINNFKVLATVGSFNEQKNQNYLFTIVKELILQKQKIKLVLIGDGGRRKEYENQVKKLGIENDVIFMGRVSNVNEILNGMDIMLLPSLYEGLPNVVLEWQANGLNSIISDNVTKECKVTPYVRFLKLQDVEMWKNEIMNSKVEDDSTRFIKSQQAIKDLKENGFEIESSVKSLEKIYND